MLLRLTCLLLLSLCLPLTALAEDAPLNEVRPGLYAAAASPAPHSCRPWPRRACAR
jgi:hypothetical protein